MRALRIYAAEDLRFEEQQDPVPGEGEVRLGVKYVGICGSDQHYYRYGANGEYTIQQPLTPGHELSAVIDLDPLGEWAPGTPVTVHPARFGNPSAGLEDRPHLWPGGDYLGSAATSPHRQGGAAELLVVERQMIRVLPQSLPLKRAALAEPLAVALRAVAVAGDVEGARVLVLGSGPIGQLVIAALVEANAAHIAAADLRQGPLGQARALGAQSTYLVGHDSVEDSSYDVVFECSGAAPSLSQAVRAARKAGVVVQLGMLPDTEVGVNLAPVLAKELELKGAFRFIDEIDHAVELLRRTPELDQVITSVVPAAQAVEGFDIMQSPESVGKVLIQF